MQCPVCHANLNEDAKFCLKCGSKIPRCPTCGEVIRSRSRFCGKDGTLLPQEILDLFPEEPASSVMKNPEPIRREAPKARMNDLKMDQSDFRQKAAAAPAPQPPVREAPRTYETMPANAAPEKKPSQLCVLCGAPAGEGDQLCPECRANSRRRAAAQQQKQQPSQPRQPNQTEPARSANQTQPARPSNQTQPAQPRREQPQRQPRFCGRCGNVSSDGQPICPACRAKAAAVRSGSYGQGYAEKKSGNGVLIALIIVLVVVILLLAGLAGYVAVTGNVPFISDKTEETTQTEATENEDRIAAEEEEEDIIVVTEPAPTAAPQTEPPTEAPTEPPTEAPTEPPVTGDAQLLYFIEYCDSVYMTSADVEGFDEEQCRLARNAIYAKSGRKFNDASLQAYYEQFDWYVPWVEPANFTGNMLNSIQNANLNLIMNYESQHGYR